MTNYKVKLKIAISMNNMAPNFKKINNNNKQ